MGIITIPTAPWRPDMPPLTEMSGLAQNCVHKIGGSYGPVQDFATLGGTLTARCQGAYAAEDVDGNITIFSADATDLFKLAAGGGSFTNISKSAAAYNCSSTEFWRFCIFGQRVVATNITDPIQTFLLGTDTKFSDLAAAAPKARYCATVKQWLMVANTHDSTSGDVPYRVWWCAINDPTTWPVIGSATAVADQSDYNDIPGEGNEITGIVGNLGTADAAVFMEHAVFRVIYVGPPSVFNFYPAEGVRGCRAPLSITQLGAVVFYLGEDGFYMFDGTNSVPIGAGKVDKFVLADLDQSNLYRVNGAVDPINKFVVWAYPGSQNSQGNPNRLLIYNWVTQEWTICALTTEFVFRTLGQGYTLDGLDTVSTSIDALPYSLDSRQWVGGAPILGGFNTSHIIGQFSGSNLSPTVYMPEKQIVPGRRSFIRNARPLVDGGTPTVSFGTRDNLESAIAFNAGTPMNSLGWCPQRVTGRFVTPKITLPAATTYSHIGGVELDLDQVGMR